MVQTFFLAGAPAVGKSTTAHALAAHFQKSIIFLWTPYVKWSCRD